MFILKITRGRFKSFKLVVKDSNDALIDLSGKTLIFSAKKRHSDDDPPVITKSSSSGITHAADQPGVGKGLATLKLSSADTALADISKTSMTTLIAELEIEQVTDEPETLDSGYLQINPPIKQSV
jgi:hypothetical protein